MCSASVERGESEKRHTCVTIPSCLTSPRDEKELVLLGHHGPQLQPADAAEAAAGAAAAAAGVVLDRAAARQHPAVDPRQPLHQPTGEEEEEGGRTPKSFSDSCRVTA